MLGNFVLFFLSILNLLITRRLHAATFKEPAKIQMSIQLKFFILIIKKCNGHLDSFSKLLDCIIMVIFFFVRITSVSVIYYIFIYIIEGVLKLNLYNLSQILKKYILDY